MIRKLGYPLTILLTAAVTFGIALLLMNIRERKVEAREHFAKIVDLNEDTVDPAEWGKNFPREYDGYKAIAQNTQRTRYGGSEAMPASKLEAHPALKRIFAGYAFSVDYRDRRGHAFMLEDQDKTERTHAPFKQPGACLQCHASNMPAYRAAGTEEGKPQTDHEKVMKGFEKICPMPLSEARKLVTHPISCLDCHDPQTNQLRVTRPGFFNGIAALARSDDPVPHLPSIEQWRKGKKDKDYDPNEQATRQEMRSFVCGQCHVEYYFKPDSKLVTYPWHKGLKVEQMEAYYDEIGFTDWKHKETEAPVLKAQHPEFEMWSQGVHARSGVACADCHMPYIREGAVKISDHNVRSPLLNIARACQTCHRYSEAEIKARAEAVQDRNRKLMDRAEEALLALLDALKDAKARNVPAEQLNEAQQLQRKAQWRLDFVEAENSMGFHAPQEAARILGEAIDYARQGQISAMKQPR
jgi:nitrite reductase (cytochrome c-552)